MVAERTWAAREAQKKAAAEAAIIIENNKAKPPQEVPAASSPATERNTISSHSLSTTQWLAAGSIVVSLVEFITNVKSSRPSTTKTLPHNMPHNMQKPAPAEPEPATVAQPKKGSLIKMN